MTKKLIKMVKKWQNFAAFHQNKRIPSRKNSQHGSESFRASSTVNKGHFVVYTVDQGRFMVPLGYLNNSVFIELLNMSEEEYGLPRDMPITLPCDSIFMDYVLYLIQQGRAAGLHEALVQSIASNRYLSSSSSSLCEGPMKQTLLVY